MEIPHASLKKSKKTKVKKPIRELIGNANYVRTCWNESGWNMVKDIPFQSDYLVRCQSQATTLSSSTQEWTTKTLLRENNWNWLLDPYLLLLCNMHTIKDFIPFSLKSHNKKTKLFLFLLEKHMESIKTLYYF